MVMVVMGVNDIAYSYYYPSVVGVESMPGPSGKHCT